MQRMSEEQMAILSCYSGTKDEVTKEMMIAIPFIEDFELREMTEELLIQIDRMRDEDFVKMCTEDIMEAYDETKPEDSE